MAKSAKNMLDSARHKGPIRDRACPNLLSAGRFTMSQRPGASAQQHSPDANAGTTSQLVAGSAQHRSISSVVWVLECFTQGQMDLSIEQSPVRRVKPGWATLYSPNTHYHEYALPDQSCHSVVIYFDPGQGDILKRLKQLEPSYRFIHDPQQQLAQLVEQIVRQLFGQDAEQLAAMGKFLHAMSLLSSCADDGDTLTIGTAGMSTQDDMVTHIQKYMRQHLHETIGVADMARQSAMSESGFAHAYRRLAGVSPMTDLRKFRVEAVKMQLLHNRLSLAQIAHLTGFSDAFHLSHVFRKVVGISPRQFKQQAAAGTTKAGQSAN